MEFSYSSKLEKLKILISYFIGNASCMTQEELRRRKDFWKNCMNSLGLIVRIFKGSNRFVPLVFKFLQRDWHVSCVFCRLILQQNEFFYIKTVGM